MDYSLVYKYLKKYKSDDICNYNYVTLTQPTGKWKIPDTKGEVEKLHKFIIDCEEKNVDLGLAECHDDDIDEPLFYDLDIKILEEKEIDDEWYVKLLKIMNFSILKVLNVQSNNLKGFVFRKPIFIEKIINEGCWKIGIHIIYPFVRTKVLGREEIYRLIIKEVKRQNLFGNFELFDENLEEVIDKRVIVTNKILKVLCNKPNKQRYELYKIFNNVGIEEEHKYSKMDILNITSIRYNLWAENPISTPYNSNFDVEKHREEQQLNLILKKSKTTNKDSKKKLDKLDPEKIELIRKLVAMLSVQRCTNYTSWINVGLCLHNISDTDDMKNIWIEWSKKSNKSDDTDFDKRWKFFKGKDDGLKFGSLRLWAKEDNEAQFLILKLDEIDKRINKSVESDTSYEIAKVLREMYDGTYVCASIKSNLWYEFRGHCYVEIQEGYKLFINISEEMVEKYKGKIIQIEEEILNLKKQIQNHEITNIAATNEEIDKKDSRVKAIQKLIEKLKTTSFKNQVMSECNRLFYDEEFFARLNENRKILVFNDGVYDLDKREFRDGRADDFMSFTTRINYREYNETDPDIQKVYHVFSQIHPDSEERRFFFTTLAVSLHGSKKEQKFDIWTGTGSNGKSVTGDFISKSFGDYFDSPPITMLTRKAGSSSNASPEKVKLKGIRIALFNEPEHDDTVYTSILKQFSGNDMIEARGLYSNSIKFRPQLSMFLACNDLPKIETTDGGTWRRIRVLEYKSKFVSHPKAPNEYKKDKELTDQIESLAEPFMAILIHYWGLYVKTGNLHEPDSVTEFTKKYQRESDMFLEYISDRIETAEDKEEKLDMLEAWDDFKQWFKDAFPHDKLSKKTTWRKEMNMKLGPSKRDGWEGKKLRERVEKKNIIV